MRGTEVGYFVKAAKFLTLISLIKSKILSLKKYPKICKKMQNSPMKSINAPASDLVLSYYCSIFYLLISILLPFQDDPQITRHVVQLHRHKYTLTNFDTSRLSKTKESPCFNFYVLQIGNVNQQIYALFLTSPAQIGLKDGLCNNRRALKLSIKR